MQMDGLLSIQEEVSKYPLIWASPADPHWSAAVRVYLGRLLSQVVQCSIIIKFDCLIVD